mmetsp:Transcript_2500/g.3675  ORF Transcript_2500/g.3675 Transcript_2500/m.3675 type:complete len:696 (-) Transcript_2500:54-2141(-)
MMGDYETNSISSSPAESPVTPAILRGLGDRSYDKRKNAALEIEALVLTLNDAGDTDRICSIIALLGQDFATSTNANHRKGGLIGLAAIAIALRSSTKLYLDALLPPVMHCLDDPESRVRYYACESLYNIAKVGKQDILTYFNQIFDGLCKLYSDIDMDVKNGSCLLDRLIKEIVSESENFDVLSFVPLLQKYIRRTNPYLRKLLVDWIMVLDSVPDIEMIDWLPDFLDGLFNMLSDGNREIRHAADVALGGFLRDIREAAMVDFGPMVSILVRQSGSKDRANRLAAITWIQEFITLGGERLILFYSDLLSAVMKCISDSEIDIQEVAGKTNQNLLELVRITTKEFDIAPLLRSLTAELSSNHIPTRIAALHWLNMLLEKAPGEMGRYIEQLLPALLRTLSDESDDVVMLNLQVLARIALAPTEFNRVLNSVLELFTVDRRLLEIRGSLIIRKLCVLLDARSIYMALAKALQGKHDLPFVGLMVQSLNLILLTASELEEVRRALKGSFVLSATQEDKEVFTVLFDCWCHSPVSTFSLCLLAKAYHLSSAVVAEFRSIEITVGFLMQVDKLVQLLESPIFLHLRLQLLDVSSPNYPALVTSLFGLLMLLPQSAAFRTLRDRLDAACALQQNLASKVVESPPERERNGEKEGKIDLERLIKRFSTVQGIHEEARRGILRASLFSESRGNLFESKGLSL